MQTTLLSIAIGLILALVAALVGPQFVDWSSHRTSFEAEATRLVGLPVHVNGAIDARLLPTPSVTLRGIVVGDATEGNRLRAGALSFQLGLGPLLRGEIKAVEMRLVAPEIKLGLDRNGTIDWPKMAMGFSGETLSIERLSIEEGRAILTDASSGARLVLDKLAFHGEVRSLIGPLRGEGSFATYDGQYNYRIATSRYGDDGLKLRLGLEVADRPLNIETDGLFSLQQGAPQFEGGISIARPVGAATGSGKAAVSEPWRVTSKVKAAAAAATFDQIEFQYGPDDRAMKIGGKAEIKFGEQPRLQGLFSAGHIDLDRVSALPDKTRQLPFVALRTFAEMFGGSLHPGLPAQFGLNFDSVMLGGAMLQMVSIDLSSRGEAWTLEKLELRAPGFATLRANGRLDLAGGGLGFIGSVKISATDSMTFLGWLTGRGNANPGPVKPWRAQGDLTLKRDRIAVDKLHSEFDRATLDGRFDYKIAGGNGPALAAQLTASEIDVDGWSQVAEPIFGSLALERPRELDLALDVERARISGVDARKVTVNLKFDGNRLDIKRLSVENLGDAAFESNGQIELQSPSPRGSIKLEVNARDLSAAIAVGERFAPAVAEPLRRLAGRQPSGRLSATFNLDSTGAGAERVSILRTGAEGQIGAFRVQLSGTATTKANIASVDDLSAFASGEVRTEARLEADDGSALLGILGLERIAVAERGAGRLMLVASGPANRDLHVEARLAAGPFDVNAEGTAHLAANQASMSFGQVGGTIGGDKIRGNLAIIFGAPVRLDGAVEVDRIDLPVALAAAVGMTPERLRTTESGRETWSLNPFPQAGPRLAGRIDVTSPSVALSGRLTAEKVRGAVQFGNSKLTLDVFDSQLSGGKLTGKVTIFSSPDGLSALTYVELKGARAAEIIGGGNRPPIAGTLTMRATVEGAGLTPAAFAGSLEGNGEITFENAEFSGLNAQVFEALTRAVDFGIKADNKQIKEFVSIMLENGALPVRRAHSRIAIVGGQAHFIAPRVEATGAELAISGGVDIANASIDAPLILSGPPEGDVAGSPTVTVGLKGALGAAKSTINADSLVGWLSLRSVDQKSKRIEAMEAARRATTQSADLPSPFEAPAFASAPNAASLPATTEAPTTAGAPKAASVPATTAAPATMAAPGAPKATPRAVASTPGEPKAAPRAAASSSAPGSQQSKTPAVQPPNPEIAATRVDPNGGLVANAPAAQPPNPEVATTQVDPNGGLLVGSSEVPPLPPPVVIENPRPKRSNGAARGAHTR